MKLLCMLGLHRYRLRANRIGHALPVNVCRGCDRVEAS